MSKTRIVLEHKDGNIKDTFMKLQELKKMGIADESSLILYRGHFLPAGAYSINDFASFEYCHNATLNVSCDDVYSIWKAGFEAGDSLSNCEINTKIDAMMYWKQYMEDVYDKDYKFKHQNEITKTKRP